MIYITPAPRCNYGRWQMSSEYAHTLKARDYKDPVWVIEIDEQSEDKANDN